MHPLDIDLVITASACGDYTAPPTSCIIQNKIGAKNAAAIDINVACLSYVWGIQLASHLLHTNTYKNILVIGVDLATRGANYEDEKTFIMLGDGAGSAVLQHTNEEKGILASYFRSDGSRWDAATILYGGSFPGSA